MQYEQYICGTVSISMLTNLMDWMTINYVTGENLYMVRDCITHILFLLQLILFINLFFC